MRRIIGRFTAVLTLVSLLGLSACGNSGGSFEATSFYSEGLEIVRLMSEMVQSEEYIDLVTGDTGLKAIVQELADGDYSSPKAVYAISFSDETLLAMTGLDASDSMSEDLKSLILQRTLGSLVTQLNGRSGVEHLAVSGLCTASKTFVNENADGNVIYLYTFDNAVPIAVTFTAGENKAVSASGVFVLYDMFPCGSADEIKSFITAYEDFAVEVTEIQAEK